MCLIKSAFVGKMEFYNFNTVVMRDVSLAVCQQI